MIDLHSHFLPGIDDGAKSVEESIAMLSDSYLQGVSICVATPHCVLHHEDSIKTFLKHRERSLNLLTENISDINVPKLVMGAEVYFDNDLSEHPDIKSLCLGDSPYLLLEFPHTGVLPRSFDWIYELTLCGVKPIIAHIERYPERERILNSLTGLDVIYQINATTFLSFSGRRVLRSLLKYDVPYIVSSDMHNNSMRPSKMKEAYTKAKKLFPDICDELFLNSEKLIIK